MSSPVVSGPGSGRCRRADVGAAPAGWAVPAAAHGVRSARPSPLHRLGGAPAHLAAGELLDPPGPAPLRKGLSG
jgi:hypothetical protein